MEKYEQLTKELSETLLSDENKEKILSDEFRYNTFVQKIEQVFGIPLADLKGKITSYISKKPDDIATDFVNIAPYNDYSKLTYDKEEIAKFLKEECVKPENWKLFSFEKEKLFDIDVVKLVFCCTAIDEKDQAFKGFVFLNNNSKVKYAFAKYTE